MSVATGRYKIVNVRFRSSSVALNEPGDGCPLTTNISPGQAGDTWDVLALDNGRYILQNASNGSFANAGDCPLVRSAVEAGSNSQEWSISRTRFPGQYIVAAPGTGFCWGLEYAYQGIPVTLVESGIEPDQQTHWRFQTVPPASALACCMPGRRAGTSTRRLELVPMSAVLSLPYGIRLMRDAPGEGANDRAADILWLVATLRDRVCHMPPVFHARGTEAGFWIKLTQFHGTVNAGWTFAYTLQGLIDLASTIPGPATISFERPPVEVVEVVNADGDRIDTSLWHPGARCIAAYCLQILRSLPEHRC